MNLYVGNLPYSIDDGGLENLFNEFGEVQSAKVIMDRDYGRSKGFGFVEMASQQAGQQAIEKLNGSDYDGRALIVSEARPRESGGDGGRRGGGGGGYGGGGY